MTACIQFRSEVSDVLFTLVATSDKIIVVGDFNIHMESDTDSFNMAFKSLFRFKRFLSDSK